ncbi:MAG: glycosyltransferase family 4 protein, partial [Myxococcota bacterium]
FVGRFDRVKGADLMLDAFAELARRRPGLRLRFLGPDTGLMVGGREISFETYVADRFAEDVRARIDYEGAQPRDVVDRARLAGAVTVACSRYETFSLTVLEAMAAGCPVVASAVGGVPEFLVDGENGLLFPSESVAALVAAIERLLDDRALAARLGAAARRDVQARFGVDAVAAETEAFHRDVVSDRR